MELPTDLTTPNLHQLSRNDTIPSNINPSTISFLSEFLSAPLVFITTDNPRNTVGAWDTGSAVDIGGFRHLDQSPDNQAWTSIEVHLVRLDTKFTPSGRFPRYLSGIGYDAAVCVNRYEPWVIETYNSSIASPSALRIVAKENGGTLPSPSGNIQGSSIVNTRSLNATGKGDAFDVANNNSITRMIKDDGRYGDYSPSPTVGPIVRHAPVYYISSNYSTGHFIHQRHWTV